MIDLAPAVRLLKALEANNSKEWGAAHKGEIESDLLSPCRTVADELRQLLESECHTKLEVKIYRLHRDLRFSKDKTPYNTHFRFSLWHAGSPQETSVCFHFSVETERLTSGVGLREFKDRITDFRERCAQLTPLLTEDMRLSEIELKMVPAGIDAPLMLRDHFRRKGLTVWIDRDHRENQPVCFDESSVQALVPMYRWLASLSN